MGRPFGLIVSIGFSVEFLMSSLVLSQARNNQADKKDQEVLALEKSRKGG